MHVHKLMQSVCIFEFKTHECHFFSVSKCVINKICTHDFLSATQMYIHIQMLHFEFLVVIYLCYISVLVFVSHLSFQCVILLILSHFERIYDVV